MGNVAGLAGHRAIWGAGMVLAVVVAGGLYLAGAFTPDPRTPAEAPQPELAQPSSDQPVPSSGPGSDSAGSTASGLAGPAPAAPATASDQPVVPPVAAPSGTASPRPPSIDVFRLDPDGSLLLAGSSEAGWKTSILMDGALLALAQTDANGQFVQFLTLGPSDSPRVLSLRMSSPQGGDEIASVNEVIIAPLPTAASDIAPDVTAPDSAAGMPPDTAPQVALRPDKAPAVVPAQRPVPADAGTIDGMAGISTDVADAPAASQEAIAHSAAPPAGDSLGPLVSPSTGPPAAGARSVADQQPDSAMAASPDAPPETSPIATSPMAPPPAPAADPGAPGGRSDQAAQTPLVLMSDETGITVLQGPAGAAAPQAMTQLALDSISYSETGVVQLAGRGAPQGFLRIYLDNSPVTTSRTTPDGQWRTDLPQVDMGVYTLRIDEVGTDGAVISRVETPFKREDQALLSASGQDGTGPAPRARVVTVQPGNTLWAISRETYGQGILYVRVFEVNSDRIRNPDLIYPGQVFTLPD